MQSFLTLKKTAVLLTSAALLFTACKKEDTVTPEPTPQPANAKLQKISRGTDILEFVYGSDGLQALRTNLSDVSNGEVTTLSISYTADKKISELKAPDGTRIKAVYQNARLAQAIFYDGTGQEMAQTDYNFQNEQLQSLITSSSGLAILKMTFDYDAAGNVSKASTLQLDPLAGRLVPVGYTTYTYDGKSNPLFAHQTLLYLLMTNTGRFNVTKESEFDEQNTPGDVTEYSYQYNNKNLPQSAVVKVTAPGQAPTTSTMTFSYQ